MHVQIIIGSIREGRVAKPVGDWVHRVAGERDDMTVEMLDLKEWDLPMFDLPDSPIKGDYRDPHQKRWGTAVARGDAYVLVCPEYNHGYTPPLKNALDYLYAEWNRKPAAFVAYGGVEGARSVEQLRQVLIELQMAPLREALHIEDVWSKIDDREFTAGDAESEQLDKVLDELVWWGRALGSARKKSA